MKLFAHQKAGVTYLTENPRYALWWDCGTGKTLTVLMAISQLKRQNKVRRVLVVCPKVLIESVWKADAVRFVPHLRVASWHDHARAAFWTADVAVINYESFWRKARELAKAGFDMVVFDESSKLKDPQSKTSKAARELSLCVQRCVCLSGTPAPNDALEYWSQLFCVNPAILGPNYYKFRMLYGTPERIYVAGGDHIDKFHANPGKLPYLLQKIGTVSHTLRKCDALDLPPQVDRIITVDLDAYERKAYDKLQRDAVIELRKTVVTADNVLAEIMKLRQVCNGWVYDAERIAHHLGTSKGDALLELVDEIGQQAILWVEFTEDAYYLNKLLEPQATMLIGGMTPQQQARAIQTFRNGEKQYLIANPAAAGHGLTFINCYYSIYYGLGWSWELHKQSRDRTHRIGQEAPSVTYYYLLASNTVELDIYDAVINKRSAHEKAMEWLRRIGGKAA